MLTDISKISETSHVIKAIDEAFRIYKDHDQSHNRIQCIRHITKHLNINQDYFAIQSPLLLLMVSKYNNLTISEYQTCVWSRTHQMRSHANIASIAKLLNRKQQWELFYAECRYHLNIDILGMIHNYYLEYSGFTIYD